MTSLSATHASLIQGVSQQADISRGTASAASQENCLNEVLDGVVSRMGSVVRSHFTGNYVDPFVHQIRRNREERYIILIENGQLRIINKVSGVECSITGNINGYLGASSVSRKTFQAVTVGDTTFLLNRQKTVSMSTGKTAARSNKGCVYVRAGGYSLRYSVGIVVGGQSYWSTHETPDNSVSGNAQYIATDHIAEQFRLSLNTTIFPQMVEAGHGNFSVVRYGSTLVIQGPTGKVFDLRTTDGVGDTYLKSFVDRIKGVADLPVKCAAGYKVKVMRAGGGEAESYFLEYVGGNDSGHWQEIAKWDTPNRLDANTMPHMLVNTGLNTFEVKTASWGSRISGDGVETAVDPSFVGHPIRSLQFISGRLSAVSASNMVLSRSRNAYVYFPDTSQTNLDTAPIDYDISNGSSTDVEYAVVAGGKMQFWGDGQQTYLDSGNDAIRESTTEVLPMANYSYDGEYPPIPSGMSSLSFSTTVGRWAKVTEVFLRGGVPQGEIVTTAHVPKLLDGTVRCIGMGDGAGKAFYLTSKKPKSAYLYQWYNQGEERVQSAWNTWKFPSVGKILWVEVDGDVAYFLMQWDGIVTLESVQLDSIGDEDTIKFPLRLDHRIDETRAVFDGDHFILTLPYPVREEDRPNFTAYPRLDVHGKYQRGQVMDVSFVDSRTVHILYNDPDLKFFFGTIPVAKRAFSRLYAKDRNDQPIAHEKLLIRDIYISHKDTVEYSVVIHLQDGTQRTQRYEGRSLGDTNIFNQEVPIRTGNFKAKVGEETENVTIELINATPFPCIWTSSKYDYDLTVRNG